MKESVKTIKVWKTGLFHKEADLVRTNVVDSKSANFRLTLYREGSTPTFIPFVVRDNSCSSSEENPHGRTLFFKVLTHHSLIPVSLQLESCIYSMDSIVD